ncbi:MAG: hypothetical protein ACE5GX_10905 [Thermoanaerobaculia bacterium]
MSKVHPTIRARLSLAALCLSILAFTGNCTLGPLQAFLFHFTVDEAVEAGSAEEVHKAFYPIGVNLKKYYVRVSGYLDTKGADPPSRITVTIKGEDQATAKRNQKITLKMSIKADGTFTATKRIRKNIPGGTVQTISANPSGADIPAGSEVWACIDIANKKGDLAPASDCHSGNTGGTPTADIQVVEVVDDAFEPKRINIKAGDTVRWVLRGNRSNHTSTEDNLIWDSGFAFSNEGDFFEHTFDASTDGKTFRYYCLSHQNCCEMQGSVLVGDSAPDPGTDY